jgi:hypothetical protein
MTLKTVTWVSDIGEPTDRQVRYINVAFQDKDTAYIGKKNIDTAVEVHGLLTEALNKPIEFTLEESGTNKHGGTKFKIKAFGEYQPAPFVPGAAGSSATSPRRSPEHDQFIQERMDRRTALMQAVTVFGSASDMFSGLVQRYADEAYEWLRKTSESTSSEQQSPLPQAGVDSESTSPAAGPVSTTRDRVEAGVATKGTSDQDSGNAPAGDDRGGQSAYGEGVGCPPHDLDLDIAPKAQRFPCRRCGFWIKPTVPA